MQTGAKEWFFAGTLEQWIDKRKLTPKPSIDKLTYMGDDGGDVDSGTRVALVKGKVIASEIVTSGDQTIVIPK